MSSQHPFIPATLVVRSGPYTGRRARLAGAVCAIGTDARCHLRPPDLTVSPVHATIHYHEGAYYVKDQRSSTGTFVNDRRVDMVRLTHGDTLRLGGLVFTFEHTVSAPPPSIRGTNTPAVQTGAVQRSKPRSSVSWTARLYSVTIVAFVILGIFAVIVTAENLSAPPPPPPEFNPSTAAPATLLYFWANW